MDDVTKILDDADDDDPSDAEKLLPLIYDELRKLAAAKLAGERANHSLQATSLVHEAYMRLVNGAPDAQWDGQGHFFSAAAEAMRRILVDRARRKLSLKRGGDFTRKRYAEDSIIAPKIDGDLLDLDIALRDLEQQDVRKADLVKLRYFVGLTLQEAADILDISISTADRDWAYARAWLFRQVSNDQPPRKDQE
ncbi:ECF-type sigma factor [Mariniblastus sp.]|nr:ECF-type sigma factor [Mariniblastus sp.]